MASAEVGDSLAHMRDIPLDLLCLLLREKMTISRQSPVGCSMAGLLPTPQVVRCSAVDLHEEDRYLSRYLYYRCHPHPVRLVRSFRSCGTFPAVWMGVRQGLCRPDLIVCRHNQGGCGAAMAHPIPDGVHHSGGIHCSRSISPDSGGYGG